MGGERVAIVERDGDVAGDRMPRGRPTGRMDDGEFIAAEPGADQRLGRGGGDPFGGELQEGVALLVPEAVVDSLEPVEIDQQQRMRAARMPGTDLLEQRLEAGARGEPGEAVDLGQPAHLVEHLLFRGDVLLHAEQADGDAVDLFHQRGDADPAAVAARRVDFRIEGEAPAILQRLVAHPLQLAAGMLGIERDDVVAPDGRLRLEVEEFEDRIRPAQRLVRQRAFPDADAGGAERPVDDVLQIAEGFARGRCREDRPVVALHRAARLEPGSQNVRHPIHLSNIGVMPLVCPCADYTPNVSSKLLVRNRFILRADFALTGLVTSEAQPFRSRRPFPSTPSRGFRADRRNGREYRRGGW